MHEFLVRHPHTGHWSSITLTAQAYSTGKGPDALVVTDSLILNLTAENALLTLEWARAHADYTMQEVY